MFELFPRRRASGACRCCYFSQHRSCSRPFARARAHGTALLAAAAAASRRADLEPRDLRREGEARTRRSQEVTKEISGWKHRLETAKTRNAELVARKETSEAELKEATSAPEREERLFHQLCRL